MLFTQYSSKLKLNSCTNEKTNFVGPGFGVGNNEFGIGLCFGVGNIGLDVVSYLLAYN